MQHVTVHNPDTHNSLHLLSISGSTLHFHCSFFSEKVRALCVTFYFAGFHTSSLLNADDMGVASFASS